MLSDILRNLRFFAYHETFTSPLLGVNDLDSLYVVGLGLQSPELKLLFQSDISLAEILNVKVWEINNFGNNFLFIFFIFIKVQLPI